MPIQNPLEQVHLAVVNALVELLPPSWSEAALDVERTTRPGGRVEHSLIIRNANAQSAVVVPSDELLLAVRSLDQVFTERKHPFKALHLAVRQSEDGAWDFTVAHSYVDADDA